MTYAQGGLIQAVDYNTFAQGGASPNDNVANINTLWGTGTGDKGWGQTTTITPVSAAATVTATQWATLFSRFTSSASQTNTMLCHSTPRFREAFATKPLPQDKKSGRKARPVRTKMEDRCLVGPLISALQNLRGPAPASSLHGCGCGRTED